MYRYFREENLHVWNYLAPLLELHLFMTCSWLVPTTGKLRVIHRVFGSCGSRSARSDSEMTGEGGKGLTLSWFMSYLIIIVKAIK